MFGFKGKKQKVDVQSLVTDTSLALSDWADNSDTNALLSELGLSRQQLLDVVSLDDEVESCREDIRSALVAEPWRIWGEDSDDDQINRIYRIIRKHIETFIDLVVSARMGGYAVAEYIYKKESDGFLTLDRVISKVGELDSYQPMRDGNVVFTAENGDEILIDLNVKHLLITSKATPSSPFGDPLAARAYPAIQLRKKGIPYANQFLKRYAQPYIIGKRSGFGDLTEYTNKLFRFLSGGAIAIGQDDSLDVVKIDSDGQAFQRIERLANMRIQKLLLGRVKTSELENGSRSAQETDDETRENRMSAYLSLLSRALQHAVDALIAVNKYYGISITAPQGLWFEFQREAGIDLSRAQRDKEYLSTGQIRLTKDYFVDVVGYEPEHIEMSDLAKNNEAQFSLSEKSERFNHLMHSRIDKLSQALNQSESYQDFEKKLGELSLQDDNLVHDLSNQTVAAYADGLNGKVEIPQVKE